MQKANEAAMVGRWKIKFIFILQTNAREERFSVRISHTVNTTVIGQHQQQQHALIGQQKLVWLRPWLCSSLIG